MKSLFFRYLFFLFLVSGLFYACVKKKSYSEVPEIEYKDFYPFTGDSGVLVTKFTDGNGDIGVGQEDTTKTFWYTYYYFDTISDKYVAYYDWNNNDTLRIGYIVKAPTDSYKGKPISGEISIKLQQYRHTSQVKKIKYVFYLLDAAGNKSNVVTSPELDVP